MERARGHRRVTPQERREQRAGIDDPAVVMEAAAAFLSVRPRSVAETRRRLRHHGYQEALVEGVLEQLVELGYLDDEAFARSWVESRDRARPRGESALRRELALKGIDRDVARTVLEERAGGGQAPPWEVPPGDGDGPIAADRVAAQRLLDRKQASLLRELDPRKRRQKAYALLARNGFGPEICRSLSATVAEQTD